MMKVDVTKELHDQRKGVIESPQLKEAQFLLEATASEERSLLKEAGLDSNFAELETEVGVNLERAKFEDSHSASFHTEAEIKMLCVKYKLRFLPSQKFKGVIDPVLGAKLVRFFKEKKIDSARSEANSNLFILAPAKAFNMDEKRKPEPVDPVLFFRVSTKEGFMYTVVHKWGNDFSIRRRLLGIMYESETSFAVISCTIRIILFNFLFALCGVNPLYWLPLLLSVVAGTLSFIFWRGCFFWGEGSSYYRGKYRNKISANNWNSSDTYKD